jgi:hypothetical protein
MSLLTWSDMTARRLVSGWRLAAQSAASLGGVFPHHFDCYATGSFCSRGVKNKPISTWWSADTRWETKPELRSGGLLEFTAFWLIRSPPK